MSIAFQHLLKKIRACEVCAKHLPLGPRPIVQLSPSVRILLIGQAPGRVVHTTGIPWNDISGDRLRAWLGLTREEFYNDKVFGIMPMGFCFPGTGPSGDHPPRPECAPIWHPEILKHLNNVQMTLLIGRYAIERYLPLARNKNLTTIIQDGQEGDYIPLVHPSPRNQRWLKNNPWFENQRLPLIRARLHEILATH